MRLSLRQKALVSIAIAELAGAIGSVFTFPAIATWYAALVKPAFTPPSWVFGPAWMILYALMGAAAALVWDAKKNRSSKKMEFIGTKQDALSIYGVQLGLNVLWSFIFFGLRSPYLAMIEIAALWVAVAITIFHFHQFSRKAALLLIPYLAWITFAAALNAGVWLLNL